jgi:membrane protease YdiL (CAAX protease family)
MRVFDNKGGLEVSIGLHWVINGIGGDWIEYDRKSQ